MWTPFNTFWFETNASEIAPADSAKVADIANYLAQNPDQQAGIDGANDSQSPSLSGRRVASVRQALLAAGVPASRIQTGDFGTSQQRPERRVEVLVSLR
jgi:outer membrane protein OmpA-like peptidoglycan-associated protein